jgi:Fe-Mn family superoxide dismutase
MEMKQIQNIVKQSVGKTLLDNGIKAKILVKESVVMSQKAFPLKTEFLSSITKENHFRLYKSYVESFNQVSSKLDTVEKINDPMNSNNSEFRRLKLDEQHNANGIKLHELYFMNISDLSSKIGADSITFQRLARDWGSFENWQFDFRACGMAATEGWAVLYYDPFKARYFNTFIEKHTENIPICGVPVLVIDTWHHAWFRDYPGEKVNYLNNMLREIAWSVVEARMSVAEKCNLQQLFMIQPASMGKEKEVMFNTINQPPIQGNQVVTKIEVGK